MNEFFDPEATVEIHRRKLPHWSQGAMTYFVTFHLADSLPAKQLAALDAERKR
jgi:hypothetical protein